MNEVELLKARLEQVKREKAEVDAQRALLSPRSAQNESSKSVLDNPAKAAVSSPRIDPSKAAVSSPRIDPSKAAVSSPRIDPSKAAVSSPRIDPSKATVSSPRIDPSTAAVSSPRTPNALLSPKASSKYDLEPSKAAISSPNASPRTSSFSSSDASLSRDSKRGSRLDLSALPAELRESRDVIIRQQSPRPPPALAPSSSGALSPRSPGPLKTQMSPRLMRVELVVNELIQTEKAYVGDLDTLISVFLFSCKHVLNTQELLDVFCNVEALKMLHDTILSEMQKEALKAPAEQNWGAIFAKHVNAFRHEYQLYTKNQDRSHAVRAELEKTNSGFKDVLSKAYQMPQVKRLDLKGFLIKPVQRICKYPLLLRELSKAMDGAGVQNLEAKRSLGTAMHDMSDILQEANDFMNTLRPKRRKSGGGGGGSGDKGEATTSATPVPEKSLECSFCKKPVSSASEVRVSENLPYHAGLCYLRSLSQQVCHRVKSEEEVKLDQELDRCANISESVAVDSSFIIPKLLEEQSDEEEVDPDP